MAGIAQVVSNKLGSDGELPMAVEVIGYQKVYSTYAEIYGRTVRVIKRWVKIGRDALEQGRGSMPPMDEPWRMPEWWQHHMKHKVPDDIRELAEKTRPESLDEIQQDVTQNHESLDMTSVQGVNDMGLEMMQKVVAVRGNQVAEAYAIGNDQLISKAERNLSDAVKTLRMLEKTQADMAKSGGAMVNKKAAETEFAQAISRLSSAILPAMLKVAQLVAPDKDRDELRDICIRERDNCFSVVKNNLLGAA